MTGRVTTGELFRRGQPAPFGDDPDLACRQPGTDPEMFFHETYDQAASKLIADAKAVCAICPRETQCRDWAIETHQDFGVFGGTSAGERRRIRKERRA
jgi:WhiB family redox-sensing transcriptional regulator